VHRRGTAKRGTAASGALVALLSLAAVAALGFALVQRSTFASFHRDVTMRVRPSGTGSLVPGKAKARPQSMLRRLLGAVIRDGHVTAAAACTADLTLVAQTRDFPHGLSCGPLGVRVRPAPNSPPVAWRTWQGVQPIAGRLVPVSAVPVVVGQEALGFIVLVRPIPPANEARDLERPSRRDARLSQAWQGAARPRTEDSTAPPGN
jgi:hypothetical protein